MVENVGSRPRLPGITCLLCVTLDKLPNSFETQFPPFTIGYNNRSYPIGLLQRLNELGHLVLGIVPDTVLSAMAQQMLTACYYCSY